MSDERRRFVRVEICLGATCAAWAGDLPDPADETRATRGKVVGEVRLGEIENLSSGGLMLATDDPLSEGTQVQIQFELSREELPLCAWGRVVWSAADDIGIELVSIAPADQARVDRVVEDRLRPGWAANQASLGADGQGAAAD